MNPMLRSGLAAAAGALALAGPPVFAQGLGGWAVPNQWQVGGMVLAVPTYEGSKSHRAIGFPVVAPAGGGESRVDVKGADDVRLRLASLHGLEVGPVAGWRFGRDEDDGTRLRGLGDIDGGLALGGYAAYRLGTLAAFASYSHQVTGDETGGLLRFGLESRVPALRWLTLTAMAGATWANDDYMQTYFGVTSAQAARSGLSAYQASAGIKDVHLGLTAEMPLAEAWTLRLMGRYAHLVGEAADSPVVEQAGQLSGGVGLTYRFSLGR
jgi:outer membrane scaffolding protein for murein synthesis (MipA/OmpV family)